MDFSNQVYKLNILLTGGAGYIGSHLAISLASAGHNPIIFDSFKGSDESVIGNIQEIIGKKIWYKKGDVRDFSVVLDCLRNFKIQAVIHLAGLKSVTDSVLNPQSYYSNNIGATVCLIEAMNLAGVKKLLFSSSAAIYGEPIELPIFEDHPKNPMNPYSRTKHFIEQFLFDIVRADPSWSVACLRYFNPVGSHDSGLVGENLSIQLGNLMPALIEVASKRKSAFNIFGVDFPTHDGTAVRDFIHIMDLAEAHVFALSYVCERNGWDAFNVGVGRGFSVLEVIHAFESQASVKIPLNFCKRRLGEIAVCYSSTKKINSILGWSAKRTLEQMCFSAWASATKALS